MTMDNFCLTSEVQKDGTQKTKKERGEKKRIK